MTIDEKVHDIEERVHKILYSTSSREEIARLIVELEDLAIKEYKTLERAYNQPAGFITHGGIKSSDMAHIFEDMRRLGIGMGNG